MLRGREAAKGTQVVIKKVWGATLHNLPGLKRKMTPELLRIAYVPSTTPFAGG